MAEQPASDIDVEEIWVNVTEGAELLGYHRMTVLKLLRDHWKLPESEREMQVTRHTGGYMVWFPDLVKYFSTKGHGPYPKRKHPST